MLLSQVIANCGLCISFYDILEAGDPVVYPAEGCCHQSVKFRLIVFRPFLGEVLVGRIVSSTELGIKVTVDFFDEIFIPSFLLCQPSEFDRIRSIWTWHFCDEDGTKDDFPMEIGGKVKLSSFFCSLRSFHSNIISFFFCMLLLLLVVMIIIIMVISVIRYGFECVKLISQVRPPPRKDCS